MLQVGRDAGHGGEVSVDVRTAKRRRVRSRRNKCGHCHQLGHNRATCALLKAATVAVAAGGGSSGAGSAAGAGAGAGAGAAVNNSRVRAELRRASVARQGRAARKTSKAATFATSVPTVAGYIFVDVEHTGGAPDKGRIIQLAVVATDAALTVLGQQSWYVSRDGMPINKYAVRVHNLTEAKLDAKNPPSQLDVFRELVMAFIPKHFPAPDACCVLTAHNGFDCDFKWLYHALKRLDLAMPPQVQYWTPEGQCALTTHVGSVALTVLRWCAPAAGVALP